MLDTVADWPLMTREQIRRMTGYSPEVTRKLLSALSRIGYISRIRSGRENLVVLGDAGLRYFSSKDRVQLRDMRADWGLSSDAGSGVR